MVSETGSTPTGGRVLRSSTNTTTPTHVPVHMGSPASVSKISYKRKAEKMSGSNSMKNKTEKEGHVSSNKDGEEEFDEKKEEFVEFDGIALLNVRNGFEFYLLKLRFKLSC